LLFGSRGGGPPFGEASTISAADNQSSARPRLADDLCVYGHLFANTDEAAQIMERAFGGLTGE
jgi:hypothetical protein